MLESWVATAALLEVFAEVEGMMFRAGGATVSSLNRLGGIEFVSEDKYLTFRLDHQSAASIEQSGESVQVKISSRWCECIMKGPPPRASKQTIQ